MLSTSQGTIGHPIPNRHHFLFYPLNDAEEALTKLEGTSWYQGKRSVDDYIDKFTKLIHKAGYTDPLAMVMKFRRGLDPVIQGALNMTPVGRPMDTNIEGWYHGARQQYQARLANRMFNANNPAASTPRSYDRSRPPGTFPAQLTSHSTTATRSPPTNTSSCPPPTNPFRPTNSVPSQPQRERRETSQPTTAPRPQLERHIRSLNFKQLDRMAAMIATRLLGLCSCRDSRGLLAR